VTLHEFLRRHKENIIALWEQSAEKLSPARALSRRALRDHMPHLIDELADAAEQTARGERPDTATAPDVHAMARLGEGYDLRQVAEEYAMLRACILRELAQTPGVVLPPQLGLIELMNATIDDAVVRAVTCFHAAHSRTLSSLDRLSEQALARVDDLQEFLVRLLHVLVTTTEVVDEATLLLREGDRIVARASVGLEVEVEEGWSLAIGEGFAGLVAARREPMAISGDDLKRLVKSTHIRERGFRALYGIPLLEGDEVLGVAHIGTRSAGEFSSDDLQLLRAMARRASALISQYRLHARLRASEAKLQSIVANAPVLITVKEAPDLRYSLANQPIEMFTGRPAAELIGKTDDEAFASMPDALRAFAREAERRVLETGEVQRYEQEVVGADGAQRTLLVHKFPLVGADDERYGVGTIAADVTDRKRIDEARERFIAILGHDLRNPLGAITMGAAVLEETARGPQDAAIVRRIVNSANRMERMIEELLDFARARLGAGIPVAPKPIDLGSLLPQLVEELRLAHPSRTIELVLAGELRGEWDRERIAQVVSNLLSNAIQHGADPVRVAARGERETVKIDVWNDGPPIPRETLATVFDPFRGGDGRKSKGLGLGLFIAAEVVRAHRGSISVDSDGERGTTFRVVLPRVPAKPRAHDGAAHPG
jgi:PAS domain S-box-containing protein